MKTRPIPYEPTQYPMKYRPLGYGVRPEEPAAPEDPPRRRRRWLLLVSAMLLMVLLHAGIAVAFYSDSSASKAAPTAEEAAAECEADGLGGDEEGPTVPDLGSDGEPMQGDGNQPGSNDRLRV